MKEVQYIKIDEQGSKIYYKDKEMTIYHRSDGPAVEWFDGGKFWYSNNKIHRGDGPAIEHADGTKEWWVNGNCHRTDGPAYEGADGTKRWYIDNVKLTEERVKAKMQPKININGKDFTVEELNQLIGAAKGK